MSFSSGIWKKASLHRAWIAAHWEGKITRKDMMTFSIDECVEDMKGEKFALRISGHLLLGVLRIFSRKVGYLLTDCQEVLIRIKLAFRPGLGDQAIITSNAVPDFDISNYDIRNFIVCINDSPGNEVRTASRDEITLKEDVIVNRMDVLDDNDLGGPMEDFESLSHQMETEVDFVCSTGDEFDRSTLDRTTSMMDSGVGSPSFLDSDGFLSPSFVPPRLVRSLRGSNRSESLQDPIVSLQSTEDKTSPPSPDIAEPVATCLPESGSDVACCSTTTNGLILENDDDEDDDAMMIGNDETGFSDSDGTVEMVDVWNLPEAKQNGVCEAGTSGVAGDILVPKFMSTPKHPTKVSSAKHLGTSRKRLLLETCTEVDERIQSEASEKRRKRKRRRKDIIDVTVYVSRHMKNWMKDEIKTTVRPFVPAKKERRGAEMLLGPGRPFISRNILQVYKDSLVVTDRFSTSDGVSDSGESTRVHDVDINQLDADTNEDETTTLETRRSCNGSPVLFLEDSGFVSSQILVNVPSNSASRLDQQQVDESETVGAGRMAENGGGTESRPIGTVDDTDGENDDRNEDDVEAADDDIGALDDVEAADDVGADDNVGANDDVGADDDVRALDDVEAADDVGADDDVEAADDFRWNSRSLHMQQTLGRKLTDRDSVKFRELVSKDNRKQVASKFYTLLFMKKTQMIEVRQDRSFGDIFISRGSNFACSC